MDNTENEGLQEDTVTQDQVETLPPEDMPSVNNDQVEQDSQTEDVSSLPQVGATEVKAETDEETTSLSTAAFRTISATKNLLDLLEGLPVPNDFDKEVDEISLFLGRTMNSITQKLA
mgnify:CR=1 FL=1